MADGQHFDDVGRRHGVDLPTDLEQQALGDGAGERQGQLEARENSRLRLDLDLAAHARHRALDDVHAHPAPGQSVGLGARREAGTGGASAGSGGSASATGGSTTGNASGGAASGGKAGSGGVTGTGGATGAGGVSAGGATTIGVKASTDGKAGRAAVKIPRACAGGGQRWAPGLPTNVRRLGTHLVQASERAAAASDVDFD